MVSALRMCIPLRYRLSSRLRLCDGRLGRIPCWIRLLLHQPWQKQIQSIKLHRRGDTPRQPVLHTLLPPFFWQMQQLSNFRRPAKGFDDRDVFLQCVHACI